MSFYIEKYIPKSFNDLKHNKELSKLLIDIFNNKYNIPNLIIYGSAGNGKYTLIKLVLNKIYGNEIYKTRKEVFEIKSKKIKINYLLSSYHIVIDLKLHKQWCKYVVDNFLKSIVYSKNIAHNTHKIIVILNSDCLSRQSQFALRRIIEKTTSTARYIFTCNSLSKLAEPIKSRFQSVRLRAPTFDEVSLIIKDICKSESIKITKGNIKKLILNRPTPTINIKQTINLLQLSFIEGKYKKYTYNYLEFLKKMLRYMDCEPKDLTVSRIDKIREHIYTLKIKQICSNVVIKFILNYFINKDIGDLKKIKICKRVSELQHRMVSGNKDPLYIENIYYSIMRIIHSNE
jgi:replication factor C subunit 3/5